jgi:hypothetical protein
MPPYTLCLRGIAGTQVFAGQSASLVVSRCDGKPNPWGHDDPKTPLIWHLRLVVLIWS